MPSKPLTPLVPYLFALGHNDFMHHDLTVRVLTPLPFCILNTFIPVNKLYTFDTSASGSIRLEPVPISGNPYLVKLHCLAYTAYDSCYG